MRGWSGFGSRRGRWIAAISVGLMIGALPIPASPARAAGPGYVSVVFGRMQWVTVGTVDGGSCVRLPNTVTLAQAHDALDARGIDGVGVVVTTRTPESGFRCFGNYTTHPGWDLLADWRGDGWTFVSGGSHVDIRGLGYLAQVQESCGRLNAFTAHGLDGSGMYAYGNDTWSAGVQTDPVSRCFDVGRTYESFGPNRRGAFAAPWLQTTHSVNGGLCNDPTRPCFTMVGKANTRYQVPSRLAQEMAAAPDTWFTIQFYRFVTGSYTSPAWSWDCTATDPAAHYTSQAELYCYSDFLRVMDALRMAVTDDGVVVADPATVARAWGRVRTPPAPGERRSTATSVSCAAGTCTATVLDADDGTPSAPAGRIDWSATGGTFGASTCALSPVSPSARCSTPFTPPAGGAGVTARYAGSAIHAPSARTVWVSGGADTTPPTVTMVAPRDGASVVAGSRVLVRAEATDASGIASVAFWVAGTLRYTDTVAPYSYGWWVAPKVGLRIVLEARARDRAGNVAVDRATVTTVAASS